MKFTIEEMVKATGAIVLRGQNNSGAFSVSTDTRTIGSDDIYLPLKGVNFNGHDFIADAVEKGIRGYFTSDKKIMVQNAKVVLYVKDTTEAYLKLAKFRKDKIKPITIAITGSSGKTTTKEMMASVLETQFRIHKSKLNHNNEIGLCETLLEMPSDTEVLVVEMGMRGLGEIALLSKYAEPDIALIVNSGTAHIGRLGSEENIAKAKCEITCALHEEGFLTAHDTKLLRNANTFKGKTKYVSLASPELSVLETDINSSVFIYKGYEYKLNIGGEYNIQNSLFVIEAAQRLGMNNAKIAKGLEAYHPIGQRWEIEKIKGYKVINDSYNANPESVKAAVKTFLELYKGPKVLVLGDMAELGEREVFYHKEIGQFLKPCSDTKLITVGELAKNIADCACLSAVSFDKKEDAAKYIIENIPESTTILFKASRSMEFEKIIEELKK